MHCYWGKLLYWAPTKHYFSREARSLEAIAADALGGTAAQSAELSSGPDGGRGRVPV